MYRELAIEVLKVIINECNEMNIDKQKIDAIKYALDDMEEVELLMDWSSINSNQFSRLTEENKTISKKLLTTQVEFYRVLKDLYKLCDTNSNASPCTICETDRSLCHNCTHNNGDNNLWSYSCGISF